MSNVENAVHCFGNGFNCAQAVFSAYSEQLGLSQEEALKIACPFGGGMARMAETCGAVTGAYLLIGLKNGKYLPEDNEAREKSYALVREFNKRFSEIHGTIVCRELLKNDMNIPDDLKKIREKEMFTTVCPIFVRDSATIIGELLELE